MKIRLALVLVLGSYIAWQQYQRQSMTIITTESVPESTHSSSRTPELKPLNAVGETGAESRDSVGSRTAQPLSAGPRERSEQEDATHFVADAASIGTSGGGSTNVPQTASSQEVDQAPPVARLNPVTYDAINNIQQLMTDGQWHTALDQLNSMYAQRDQLNGFERSTMLMFYTNVLLHHQMYDEAAIVFQEVVTIPETDERIRERALQALDRLEARSQP